MDTRNDDGKRNTCKSCRSAQDAARRKILSAYVRGYKKASKCAICGYNEHIEGLEFHHLDPSEKLYNVGEMTSHSIEAIQEEIDKCAVLCGTCHLLVERGIVSV